MRLPLGPLAALLSACVADPVLVGQGGEGGGGTTAQTTVGQTTTAQTTALSSSSTGAGGCDADLTNDSMHCGACDHACDGPCEESKCVPVVLTDEENGPRGIVVDDTHVYWVNTYAHQVRRISKAGGTAETLAGDQDGAWGLTRDDTHLYWTNRNGGQVRRVPLGGGAVETLIESLMQPLDIAVRASNVYVTDGLAGTVSSVPKGGGAVNVLHSGIQHPNGIAIVDDTIYVGEETTGDLLSMPLAGGGGSTIVSLGQSPIFQVRATSSGRVAWCAFGDGEIRMLEPGGSQFVLGDGTTCWGIHMDEENVYWTNEHYDMPAQGLVMMASQRTGALPVLLADGQTAPTGVTADDTAVYWSNFQANQVVRVNK